MFFCEHDVLFAECLLVLLHSAAAILAKLKKIIAPSKIVFFLQNSKKKFQVQAKCRGPEGAKTCQCPSTHNFKSGGSFESICPEKISKSRIF
jgi:hypothetical protein